MLSLKAYVSCKRRVGQRKVRTYRPINFHFIIPYLAYTANEVGEPQNWCTLHKFEVYHLTRYGTVDYSYFDVRSPMRCHRITLHTLMVYDRILKTSFTVLLSKNLRLRIYRWAYSFIFTYLFIYSFKDF